MKHSVISTGQALVPAQIRLAVEISRVEEGAMMRLIEIVAYAHAAKEVDGARIEVGRLSAWQGLYRDLPAVLTDPENSAEHLVEEFDEISYDAMTAVESYLNGRTALTPALAREIEDRAPSGLVYVEQILTHPAVRGARLGLAMLRELRALLAGSASLVLLTAIPIETPYDGPRDDFRRGALAHDTAGREALVRYYRSDLALGFKVPHGLCKPNLLAAVWPAFAQTPLFEMCAVLPAEVWSDRSL